MMNLRGITGLMGMGALLLLAPVAGLYAQDSAPSLPGSTPPNLLEETPAAAPAVPEMQVPEVADAPAPAAEKLADPVEIPSMVEAEEPEPDLFFDADSLIPTGEMGANSPRKVDPVTQPASKLIVVKKHANADSSQALLVSAGRAMKLGRYDSALDMYDGLYAKNKRDPRILMGRAVTLQHLGRFDEAMQTYEQLLEVSPNNVEAQINMLGLLGTKYPAVALRRLLEIRENNPNNVGIVAQLAVTEAQLGNYTDAMRYLGIAASMEPNNANHIFNMAVIADRAGSKKQAMEYYEQALEIDTVYGRGQSIPREAVFERLAELR